MKFTKLILLFVLSLAVISCSSDDDNNSFDYNKENLTATYKLTFLQSQEVETVNVNGFDVVTTTVATGDTFDMTVVFAANNTVTSDGTYRVNETVTQGNQTATNAYIVVLNDDTTGFSVNAATAQLTIDGSTYSVNNFSPSGFQINLSETTTEPNGDSTVYTEELRFTKQ